MDVSCIYHIYIYMFSLGIYNIGVSDIYTFVCVVNILLIMINLMPVNSTLDIASFFNYYIFQGHHIIVAILIVCFVI